MISTKYAKHVMASRRETRDMLKAGYELIDECGGKLWELHRGYRIGRKITDVKISHSGMTLWVKVEEVS